MKKTLVSIEKIQEQIRWVFLQAYEAGLLDYKNKTIGGGGVPHSKQLRNAEKLELKLIKDVENTYRQQILALLKEYGEEIIREDEELIKTDDIQELDVSYNNQEVRNQLRQEQRAILQKKRKEVKK